MKEESNNYGGGGYGGGGGGYGGGGGGYGEGGGGGHGGGKVSCHNHLETTHFCVFRCQ